MDSVRLVLLWMLRCLESGFQGGKTQFYWIENGASGSGMNAAGLLSASALNKTGIHALGGFDVDVQVTRERFSRR